MIPTSRRLCDVRRMPLAANSFIREGRVMCVSFLDLPRCDSLATTGLLNIFWLPSLPLATGSQPTFGIGNPSVDVCQGGSF